MTDKHTLHHNIYIINGTITITITILVDPIEALVEEAGKLVAEWYTVTVVKAALIRVYCCIVLLKEWILQHLAATLESKGGGAGEDDQAQSCLHIGDQHQLGSAQPRCHGSQGQKVSHPSIYSAKLNH